MSEYRLNYGKLAQNLKDELALTEDGKPEGGGWGCLFAVMTTLFPSVLLFRLAVAVYESIEEVKS